MPYLTLSAFILLRIINKAFALKFLSCTGSNSQKILQLLHKKLFNKCGKKAKPVTNPYYHITKVFVKVAQRWLLFLGWDGTMGLDTMVDHFLGVQLQDLQELLT